MHRACALAELVGGELVGDAEVRIVGLARPETATEMDVAVVFGESLPRSLAGVLVVSRSVLIESDRAVIRVEEPRIALAQLSAVFARPVCEGVGIHGSAVVAVDCVVDPSAYVGPQCVVEEGAVIGAGARLVAQVYVGRGVEIGAECLVFPCVTLYAGTRLGARVTVQAGARIGCDGFGYVTESSVHPKVHSLGGVYLDDEVEVGANTTIERGTFEDTTVGRGTKIGDACGIGHNAVVGHFCLLAGHIAMGGSVRLGNRVQLAMGVVVRDHVAIGDGSVVMMGSHVVGDVPAGGRMLGSPAVSDEVHKARVRALGRLVGGGPAPE